MVITGTQTKPLYAVRRARKNGFPGTVQYCGKWALGNEQMGNGVWMASVALGVYVMKLEGKNEFIEGTECSQLTR